MKGISEATAGLGEGALYSIGSTPGPYKYCRISL